MARIAIDYNLKNFEVISLGAGKQSTMLLLMALENKFSIRPDMAVFADTGNEPKFVYHHLEFLQEYVWRHYKFSIAVVKTGNIITDTLNHIQGKTNWSPTPPFWMSGGGFLRRQCTTHLKIRAIRKEARLHNNKRPIRMWIGISFDEQERQKDSKVQYITNYYPFVENRITLDFIKSEYKRIGVPEPGKSACIICPFHSDAYWARLKIIEPESFKLACDFDDQIRLFPNRHGKCYLHRSLQPLKNLDFTGKNSLFPEMIEECEGLCGI